MFSRKLSFITQIMIENNYKKIILFIILVMMMCKASSTSPMPLGRSLDRGFGNHLNWTTLDEAFRDSSETRKPIMLILHQKWCKACRELMPKFRQNEFITKLAPFFQLVNAMDEEVPEDPVFSPDGSYYPRILFISPDGVVHTEIFNPESVNKYLFYYYEADSVARSMLKAVHTFYNVLEEDNEL